MKTTTKRRPEILRHLTEVRKIGDEGICPLNLSGPTSAEYSMGDFVIWLRFQSQKMNYRILYYDLAVCCAFIFLLFTTIRFHTLISTNQRFLTLLCVMLVSCCVLFIGIHMLQHRDTELKQIAKSTIIDWNRYCRQLKKWRLYFRIYLTAILLFVVISAYNEKYTDPYLSRALWVCAAALFGFGIALLLKTIRAKEKTLIYLLQVNRLKLL